MKCPNCGTEVVDQEMCRETRTNRIVTVMSAAVVIMAIIVATAVLLPKDRRDSTLTGNIMLSHVSGDSSDGNYTLQLTSYVYNKGPMGCWANITFVLSDSRGWSMEHTIDEGWMPANQYADMNNYLSFPFDYPVTFNGISMGWPVSLSDIHVSLEYDLYDPVLDAVSQ